ncbi:MAG: cupin domain-containing protein [Myxococcota bacterium]|nr:cupin domain-containing protein [Myxococcota bacterium]
MASEDEAFDPTATYVQLEDGPAATTVPVDGEFWARIAERADLHDGRLVCVFDVTATWAHWEMHPAGDELVLLLDGAIDLVLEETDGERVVPLRDRRAFVVPRGVWHRAVVHRPGRVLHVTRGAGTRHRPLAADEADPG